MSIWNHKCIIYFLLFLHNLNVIFYCFYVCFHRYDRGNHQIWECLQLGEETPPRLCLNGCSEVDLLEHKRIKARMTENAPIIIIYVLRPLIHLAFKILQEIFFIFFNKHKVHSKRVHRWDVYTTIEEETMKKLNVTGKH